MSRPCNCGNCKDGPYTLDQCRLCWLAKNDFRYQLQWGITEASYWGPGACRFRGEQIGSQTCTLSHKEGESIPVYQCSIHTKCVKQPYTCRPMEEHCCMGCDNRIPFDLQKAWDWKDLSIPFNKAIYGIKFNPSVIRFRDKTVFVARVEWAKSKLYMGELNHDYTQASNVKVLDISYGELCNYACEDPRLFIHQNRLHVSFSGVQINKEDSSLAVHQMYCRVTDDYVVEEVFYPHYTERKPWEKNWGFFSHRDELYAVYSIDPHTILKIGENTATLVAREETMGWSPEFGTKRGGAAPYKRGSEWYCFFHDVKAGERKEYTLGVYTFSDEFPFRINRIGRVPLFRPLKEHRPNSHVPDVVFPGGSFLHDNLWQVSCGYYDRWSWMLRFDVNELEKYLDLAPSGKDARFKFRGEFFDDYDIWRNVYNWNEYNLPDSLAGKVVLDIGGHIGSFARACLDRGAAHVTSVEPHPTHQEMYEHNLRDYLTSNRCTLVKAAAYGKVRAEQVDLVGKGCIANTTNFLVTYRDERVTVPTIELGEIECDLLKLDCEGSEYEIVANTELSRVKEVLGEGHLDKHLPGIDWLVRTLESKGFVVTAWQTGPQTFQFRAYRY